MTTFVFVNGQFMSDFYKTLRSSSQGLYKEKMSKFISFAVPVATIEDAKAAVKRCASQYHDARHCCWAYMIGTSREIFLSSDNGEPSGTAGRPILGQINSFGLTNIVITVVRYFGGVKLGTSGLISAYREAARQAILNGEIIECHEQARASFTFPYLSMNAVMKLVKSSDVRVIAQHFDNICAMTLECNADFMPGLVERLKAIDGVTITGG